MTLTTLEPVTVEHLDFRPDCESFVCTDPPRSAVLALHTRCGCIRLACIPCRNRGQQELDRDRPTRLCPICGATLSGGWTDFVILEIPL